MPTINRAFKEIVCKIVYYGPGLGGKTTNLQFVHTNVPQKHRGDLVSLATEQDRTLFFDFLPLDIGDVKGYKTKFQLYTVPGQVFYNATRKLVLRGCDGVAFIADSQTSRRQDNVESFNNLIENLREYDLSLDELPMVLQFNKRDLPDALPVETLHQDLNPESRWPEFDAVATEGVGVRETLREVSMQILRRLNATANIVSDEEIVGERLGVLPVAGEPGVADQRGTRQAPGRNPDLALTQRSQVQWNGIGVGSGVLTIETQVGENGTCEYLLTSDHKILGMKRGFTRMLKYVGEDTRQAGGLRRTFHILRDLNTSRDVVPISAYMEKSDNPRLYVVYPGIAGEVKIGPRGEKIAL